MSSRITSWILHPLGMGAVIAFQSISEILSKLIYFFTLPSHRSACKRKMKDPSMGHLYFICRWRAEQLLVLLDWLIHISCCLLSFPSTFKLCVLEPEILLNFSYIYVYIKKSYTAVSGNSNFVYLYIYSYLSICLWGYRYIYALVLNWLWGSVQRDGRSQVRSTI